MPAAALARFPAAAALLTLAAAPLTAQVRFTDDFASGLDGWDIRGAHVVQIVDGADAHGSVLELQTDGWDVFALIEGSDTWGDVRIEGSVLFPEDGDSYLGIIYAFREDYGRTDFGNIYIKGDDSYLRVNPHRDGNVGRTLYEEYFTPLEGASAIRIGAWQRFAAEIVGGAIHVYIGNTATPQLTFDLYEGREGKVGFQPRSVGWPVRIDDIRVTSIDGFSYRGPAIPAVEGSRDSLLTSWQSLGPFTHHSTEVERGTDFVWQPFLTDARGAVITARVTEYAGGRTVAYFRTRVTMPRDTTVALHISSVDDIALFVNHRFRGFYARGPLAWHDFWSNPAHEGRRIPLRLRAGENTITIRVRGGVYASGGFFARLEPVGETVRLPF